MNPITVTDISSVNLTTYIAIGLAVLAGISFIAAWLQSRENVIYVGFGYLHLSVLFAAGALVSYLFGFVLYDWSLKDSAEQAITQVEQEAGVTIINKDSIEYTEVVQENSVISVSFNDDGKIYEGFLITEDWNMLLHIPNLPENDRELIIYGQ